MTAGELAERLEVSVRTVYRDVDSLSATGVPICAAQGKGGGVYLMEGYVLERAAFTEEEQRQLLTALRALPGEEGDALGKLSALFRREGDEWLQVRLSRWGGQSGRDGETFQALRQAIRQRRSVTFRYASSRGEVLPREVLPARLVFKGQGWYLQGYDLPREDYRSFRLTRMLDLTVTERTFHRELTPPDSMLDFFRSDTPLTDRILSGQRNDLTSCALAGVECVLEAYGYPRGEVYDLKPLLPELAMRLTEDEDSQALERAHALCASLGSEHFFTQLAPLTPRYDAKDIFLATLTLYLREQTA